MTLDVTPTGILQRVTKTLILMTVLMLPRPRLPRLPRLEKDVTLRMWGRTQLPVPDSDIRVKRSLLAGRCPRLEECVTLCVWRRTQISQYLAPFQISTLVAKPVTVLSGDTVGSSPQRSMPDTSLKKEKSPTEVRLKLKKRWFTTVIWMIRCRSCDPDFADPKCPHCYTDNEEDFTANEGVSDEDSD